MQLFSNPIILGLITLVIVIFSAILHEIAHGYVADKLGDPTARLMGRLTLDPRPHIDPFLTILLPLLLFFSGLPIFGGARPVPIDPFNFREGRKDVALVSLAGPLTNIFLALLATIILKITPLGIVGNPLVKDLGQILFQIASINVLLAIFNLIPLPPLDGSKILALFLPEEMATSFLSISNIGMFLLYILLVIPGSPLQSLIAFLYHFGITILGLQ